MLTGTDLEYNIRTDVLCSRRIIHMANTVNNTDRDKALSARSDSEAVW